MSHDWLSPRHVIVATERGKIIIFEDAELKSSYSLEELTKTEDTELLEKEDGVPKEAGALISYSGGFIASYGRDDVFVFEQLPSDGEEFNFKCIKKIKFPKVELSRKNCLIFSPQQDCGKVKEMFLFDILSRYW